MAHLLEFQQLVSDAIALRHSDIELDDAVMLEMAKTWGEREIDAIENAFSNEKRYANAFPQIALRGVFLSAVSYFEEFFRCVARCIDRNSHCRRLSECRRVLLDNWNLSTESSAEEQLWQQLRGSFEIRNLLLHVDEQSPSSWNSSIQNAVNSTRCDTCVSTNIAAQQCHHLLAVENCSVVLGPKIAREFIDCSNCYIGIHFRMLP